MAEGRKFKIARITAGLRQHDIALRVGMSQAMISFIENDMREPTPDQARLLNKAVGQTVFRIKPDR